MLGELASFSRDLAGNVISSPTSIGSIELWIDSLVREIWRIMPKCINSVNNIGRRSVIHAIDPK